MRRQVLVVATICFCVAVSSQLALAQHGHQHNHGHNYWGHGSHSSRYVPGHIDFHNGHIDIHPGRIVDQHHDHVPYRSYGGYGWSAPSTVIVPPATTVESQPNSTEPVDEDEQMAEPKFGAYENVDKVSADLASLSKTLCWTLHDDFRDQPTYPATYRKAYSVYQNAGAIQKLSANSSNRPTIAKLLARSDDSMHQVVDSVKQWMGGEGVAGTPRADSLKREVIATGSALHYLMVEVGVKHRAAGDDEEKSEPAEVADSADPADEPNAPTPATVQPQPAAQNAGDAPAANEPKFGAFANVQTVSADVAKLANRMCLTMHKNFRTRPDFKATYAEGYAVLQVAQKIRELGSDPSNREELIRQLPDLDRDMHAFNEKLGGWFEKEGAAPSAEETKLQQDLGALGGAVHYLMVDVGVQHEDKEEAAPPPEAETSNAETSNDATGSTPPTSTEKVADIESGAPFTPDKNDDGLSIPGLQDLPPKLLP